DVLLFADGKEITHGNPVVSGAKVTAEVLEQRKDKKVVAFKYKRRKGYHRTVGHRRKLTRVKIKTIDVGSKKTSSKKSEYIQHQPSTNKLPSWLIKKDKAASRTVAIALANGWA